MAKTVLNAHIHIRGGVNYVRATVEMPATEYAAFLEIEDLTDGVPAAETAHIAERVAAGSTSGV